ncbi:hypothetical protein M6D81_26225 [Paenibacillus sp. J5C_2022]|uniref:hypothetical protein n=1 Tax=Paenibacillus sp. J5C2022 TaxID=2977129 RepID=UPI0021CEFD1F|nr:hypothetical protein [Paenibacillus sp. J5C2022]MCU6712202.1 hypothetical protein [Paenibacillus sp. J5C2022]
MYTSILHHGFGLSYTVSYSIAIYATILSLFLLAEFVIRSILELRPDTSAKVE